MNKRKNVLDFKGVSSFMDDKRKDDIYYVCTMMSLLEGLQTITEKTL